MTVHVPLGEDADHVRLLLFTTAYRKVLDQELGPMAAGMNDVVLILRDSKGKPLSNGMYYIVINTENARAIGKLLILR